jgi:hypothetical protein
VVGAWAGQRDGRCLDYPDKITAMEVPVPDWYIRHIQQAGNNSS